MGNNEKLNKLLNEAVKLKNESNIPPRKFQRTNEGKIILDPNNKHDREWYEDDEAYKLI